MVLSDLYKWVWLYIYYNLNIVFLKEFWEYQTPFPTIKDMFDIGDMQRWESVFRRVNWFLSECKLWTVAITSWTKYEITRKLTGNSTCLQAIPGDGHLHTIPGHDIWFIPTCPINWKLSTSSSHISRLVYIHNVVWCIIIYSLYVICTEVETLVSNRILNLNLSNL